MYLYRIFELDENSIKTNVFSDSNIENCLNYKVNKFKINFDDLLNSRGWRGALKQIINLFKIIKLLRT